MAALIEGHARRGLTDFSIPETVLAALAELHCSAIAYCCWKGSRRIAAALSGETDLDLLIRPEDLHRVEAILRGEGFKLFPAAPGRVHPAIQTLLGHDEPTSRIIHIDLHSRLVTGSSLLREYHLPWADVILARAIPHPLLPIRILDPVSEALLLVVRSCFELRRSDPIALRHWQRLKRKFASDRAHLAARIDPKELGALATALLDETLAGMITDTMMSGRPLEREWRLRRRLRRHLAPYRAFNALETGLRTCWRSSLWIAGAVNRTTMHMPRAYARRVPGGGRVVAVLGVDGCGKSTAVKQLTAWLGGEIDVMPIYFGTGDGRPSLWLLPLKLQLPVVARLIRGKSSEASLGAATDRSRGLLYGILMTGWATMLAIEKRRKLMAARRGASRGLLVATDRYPQNEIPEFNDGPLLPRLRYVPRRLRRFEAGAYALARRLPPDLVIKLEVGTETAARREPDVSRAIIERRIDALRRLAFPSSHVVLIDAERPLAEVTRSIRREVWRWL